MVQFLDPKKDKPAFVNKHYWKLKKPDLLDTDALVLAIHAMSGFDAAKLSIRRLHELYIRVQRGLPVYEKFNNGELLKFCKDRRVLPTQFGALVWNLEKADETFKLRRFSELPPELRIRIYRLYMSSFDLTDHKVPPPITLVSKLVRHEALSVFFERRVFMCDDRKLDSCGTYRIDSLEMFDQTRSFWENAPEVYLQHVRRLEIMSPMGVGGRGYAEWTIDLTAKTRETKVVFETWGSSSNPGGRLYPVEKEAEATEGLRKVIDAVTKRDRIAFQRGDAEHILQALTLEE